MARRDPLTGPELHELIGDLLLLPRSLTGDGVRETLRALQDVVPLEVLEVPTGTEAHDWTVPQEWVLRSARLVGPDGGTVLDVRDHPLHVLGYSIGVDRTLSLEELQGHLHSDPAQPDTIPYRTSYYTERWGFCLPDRLRAALPEGQYHAVIDAELVDGSMSMGELVLPGDSDREVLVTSHICHPGMANDNLSGNVVAAAMARALLGRPDRRYTWRFLWMPGTIGELTWLATHQDVVPRIHGGIVLAGVGDGGPLTWKRSRQGDSEIDRAASLVLAQRDGPHDVVDFSPWGYAERQFCSPGYDLPVGRLSRTEHGTYPQYHTSDDDLSFVRADALAETVDVLLDIADAIDANDVYRNTKPFGEPRLGPRGLYPSMGGPAAEEAQLALLWVLNASDGTADLLEVARRSGIRFAALAAAAAALRQTDLLQRDDSGGDHS